jgi:hypothetical protein
MPVPENYKDSDTKPPSKYLRAEDYPLDTKWRLTIDDVELVEMEGRDGKAPRKRLVLYFKNAEKGLVLNAGNEGFIKARFAPGANPNTWVGTRVLVHRTTAPFGEKIVAAFRIVDLKKPDATARPAQVEPITVEPIPEEDFGDDPSVPF